MFENVGIYMVSGLMLSCQDILIEIQEDEKTLRTLTLQELCVHRLYIIGNFLLFLLL